MLVDIYNVPGIILCIIWENHWTETCSYKNIGLETRSVFVIPGTIDNTI